MKKFLVELKAKVDSLEKYDEKLGENADFIGVFYQIDTYFNVDRGRLKIRDVKGQEYSQLVYYLREDIRDPKRSRVLLAKVIDSDSIKEILGELFGIKIVVRKERKIYRYRGVQVHLDKVEGLGTFIEFELEVDEKEIEKGRKRLYRLMEEMGIKREWLIEGSYSDLLLSKLQP